ncbi:MAG: hypothetical protein ABIF85_03885 [Nanoarchaeota archaeon]|nr:class I SAM-dependent methyltransferase [Nanoarchaeota archaeon]MBU4300081.1 class I SAM-dependent methyltransferase [Nanoarchaeota archaeon]MCG2723808.1 class I SAM-dependent methyltransferase [archaeon]
MNEIKNTANKGSIIPGDSRARKIIRKPANFLLYHYRKIFTSGKTFEINGKQYPYFYHIHNVTWKNERAVELSVALESLKKYEGKKILEIGNVLSHYIPITHDVVDKYEIADGVINEDVVDYKPSKKYDLILSISTMEHVGWDEEPKDPNKIPRAIENLKKCLSPGGAIIVTMPLGENPYLDELIKKRKIQFKKQYFLKRVSKNNDWVQVDLKDIENVKYDSPYRNANGIIIGII